MNIEIRKVHNGFIFTMSGDQANKQAGHEERKRSLARSSRWWA
jgi:hypothetical protein